MTKWFIKVARYHVVCPHCFKFRPGGIKYCKLLRKDGHSQECNYMKCPIKCEEENFNEDCPHYESLCSHIGNVSGICVGVRECKYHINNHGCDNNVK